MNTHDDTDEVRSMRSLPNEGRGRPIGARTRAPVVNITAARKAFEAVKARAEDGSEEDQRLLVQAWLSQSRPYSGPGLLSPEAWTPEARARLEDDDDAA